MASQVCKQSRSLWSLSPLKWIPRIKIPPSIGAARLLSNTLDVKTRNWYDGVKYLIDLSYVGLHIFVGTCCLKNFLEINLFNFSMNQVWTLCYPLLLISVSIIWFHADVCLQTGTRCKRDSILETIPADCLGFMS